METQLETGTIKPEVQVGTEPVKLSEPVIGGEPVIESTPEAPKSEDLIQRVSKYVEENKGDVKTEDGDVKPFNYEELESKIGSVQSVEEAKELLKTSTNGIRKSFDRGLGKKFDEISGLRKELQQTLQGNQLAWTPERIRAEMNKPDFIQSAQTVASSQTEGDDEYSALSDTEKAEIKGLRDKIVQLEQNNMKTMSLQQDEHLKSKYANYDSTAVDILTTDLLQGKVQATREHLWKVRDYDAAVNRAYDLGRRDERSGVNEKLESIAAEGITTSQSEAVPEAEKGETDQGFWNRIAHTNLSKLAKAATLKK